MLYSVTPCSPTESDELRAFWCSIKTGPDEQRLHRHWQWKWHDGPAGRQRPAYLLALRAGDRIIGMVGELQLEAVVAGRTRTIAHSCNLLVHPDFRGRGLARLLIERHQADHALGFDWQNAASHRATRSAGSTDHSRVVPLVRPLDLSALIRRKLGLLPTLPPEIRPASGPYELEVLTPAVFDESMDGLWRSVQNDHSVQLVRDRAYLNWRFSRQPDHRYHLMRASQRGVLSGYLIWRTLMRHGLRVAHLADFVVAGCSTPLLDAMLGRALDLLRAERIEAVLTTTSVPRFREVFVRHGFFPWLGGAACYFHPRAPASDPDRAVFCDPSRWHLTMGDGDMELDA